MLQKLIRFVVFMMLISVASASVGWAEKRTALIIGNFDYLNAPRLAGGPADAQAVRDLFAGLGFETELKLDVTQSSFANVLAEFNRIARNSDVAVFFYAGYGLSIDGRGYLVPADSNISRATDGTVIDAEFAAEMALSGARNKLVVLDACEKGPFADRINLAMGSTRTATVVDGLSELEARPGSLVLLSATPGEACSRQQGQAEPFVAALASHLPTAGLELSAAADRVVSEVAAKSNGSQRPWVSANLDGQLYLVSSTSAAPSSSEAEIELWRSVEKSTSVEELQIYLDQYPNGVFSPLARHRITAMTQAQNSGKDAAANGSSATTGVAPAGSGKKATSGTKQKKPKPAVASKPRKQSSTPPVRTTTPQQPAPKSKSRLIQSPDDAAVAKRCGAIKLATCLDRMIP